MATKSGEQWSRRDILKIPGAGLMGAAAACASQSQPEAPPLYRRRGGRKLYQPPTEPSTIALIKGNDRRENIYRSLKLIGDQVLSGIGDRQILIKPNFVQTNVQLAATHADALRGILEFLRPHYKQEILIGEAAPTAEGTMAGYEHYGYQDLVKEYKVKLVDLNQGAYQYRYTIGVPQTAFWWLEHYPGLRRHLERHCRQLVRQDSLCRIYELSAPAGAVGAAAAEQPAPARQKGGTQRYDPGHHPSAQ